MASLQRPSAIASAPTISSACPRTGSRSSSTSASTSEARASTRWRRRGRRRSSSRGSMCIPAQLSATSRMPASGTYEAPRVTIVFKLRDRGGALADVQVRDRRAREQRRAIAGRQRAAVAFEQRLRRLPGVVPLPALEADRRQPLQRRPVAAVAPVRSRIQGERAIVLPGRLGRRGDGEVPLGRVGDGGAARRQPIERVGRRLPVSRGELEARAQIEQARIVGQEAPPRSRAASPRAPDRPAGRRARPPARSAAAPCASGWSRGRPRSRAASRPPTSRPSRAASAPSAATGSASVGSSDIARR